jgi:hypothetical protein
MNWQAVAQALASAMRETPQSVHRPRGWAGGIGGAVTASAGEAVVMMVQLVASGRTWRNRRLDLLRARDKRVPYGHHQNTGRR